MTKREDSRFNDWGPGALDFGPAKAPAAEPAVIPNAEAIDAELERRVKIRETELVKPAAGEGRR